MSKFKDGWTKKIIVENGDSMRNRVNCKTLIIDAKHYGNQMQSHFEVQSFRSGNLYQIYSYVKNLDKGNTGNVAGMLLYAKTSEEFQPVNSFMMGGNRISVNSLDIDLPFNEIAAQLEKIISVYLKNVS